MIIKTNQDEFTDYLRDASNYSGFADELAIPTDIKDIKDFISECNSKQKPISISAAGTGLTGVRVHEGGSIISVEKMNRILDFDEEAGIIRVQPGLRLIELNNFLSDKGFFYAPNPTETNSMLGGNIANNASGSRTFRYGPSRNYVQSLDVILANGNELKIRRGERFTHKGRLEFADDSGKGYDLAMEDIFNTGIKNASGYYLRKEMDLIDLFIGSEGTLGLITEISLRVLKAPGQVMGALVFFDAHDKLTDFVEELKSNYRKNKHLIYSDRPTPRLIEYFDSKALELLKKDYQQLPGNLAGAVWVEQEYDVDVEEKLLDSWLEIIGRYTSFTDETWVALDDISNERIRQFRHALPLAVNELISKRKLIKMGTDTAVPDEILKPFLNGVRNLLDKSGLEYAIWGHIGNSHIHANIFPENGGDANKGKDTFEKIMQLACSMGGTISGEHGIGKIKKQYMNLMYKPGDLEVMRRIKKQLDPHNILSRGNIFDM